METPPVAMAIVKGVPLPLAAGPHFDATCASIRLNGPSGIVLMTADGVVWGGRTLWNACLATGIQPQVTIVEDGWLAAVLEFATRDLSILETADLVASIAQRVANFATEGRINVLVSEWIRRNLGKERGFSPRQVQSYLMLARLPTEERGAVARAATVNEAWSLLRPTRPRQSHASPTEIKNLSLYQLIDALTQILDSIDTDPEMKDSLRLLAACISAKLGPTIHDAQEP